VHLRLIGLWEAAQTEHFFGSPASFGDALAKLAEGLRRAHRSLRKQVNGRSLDDYHRLARGCGNTFVHLGTEGLSGHLWVVKTVEALRDDLLRSRASGIRTAPRAVEWDGPRNAIGSERVHGAEMARSLPPAVDEPGRDELDIADEPIHVEKINVDYDEAGRPDGRVGKKSYVLRGRPLDAGEKLCIVIDALWDAKVGRPKGVVAKRALVRVCSVEILTQAAKIIRL
jgi:hypothetical protein